MESRVRTGWTVAVLAAMSASLVGCGKTDGSGDYEVILDQPETSGVNASSEDVADSAAAPAEAKTGLTASDETKQPAAGDAGQPDQSPATQTPEQDSPIAQVAASAGDTATVQTPAATPTPVDTAAGKVDGASGKPPAEADPKTTGSTDPAVSPEPEKSKPRVVTLLIPDKKFTTEGPEKALRVSFDDFDLLKVLNMDPVTEDAPSRMPKWLKDLDGKRVRVRGFMFPPFEDTNIRGFTLARDNQICCFGRNPLVYDLVDVFMRKGESTDYIQNRPFDVIGVFHIGDSIIPGELYSLDDAVVIDK